MNPLNIVSPALVVGYDYLRGSESPVAVYGEKISGWLGRSSSELEDAQRALNPHMGAHAGQEYVPSHGGASRAGALNPLEKGFLVTGAVLLGLVAIPTAIVIYIFKKGRDLEREHGEEKVTREDLERLKRAGETSGQAGLVLETLAKAKERKTMRTPFGPVPNLAARALPSAEELRMLAEYKSLGISPGAR